MLGGRASRSRESRVPTAHTWVDKLGDSWDLGRGRCPGRNVKPPTGDLGMVNCHPRPWRDFIIPLLIRLIGLPVPGPRDIKIV